MLPQDSVGEALQQIVVFLKCQIFRRNMNLLLPGDTRLVTRGSLIGHSASMNEALVIGVCRMVSSSDSNPQDMRHLD